MILVTKPHPKRDNQAMRTILRDNNEMVWHRGIRPKWGVAKGVVPGTIHTSWLHTCTFLSDISTPDDGGTFVLSGRVSAQVPGLCTNHFPVHPIHGSLDQVFAC